MPSRGVAFLSNHVLSLMPTANPSSVGFRLASFKRVDNLLPHIHVTYIARKATATIMAAVESLSGESLAWWKD
jgi:hypothetical protein